MPTSTFQIATGRGLSTWGRCRGCRSYFDTANFDSAMEVSHTRTRPWGRLDSGAKLNDYKRPMYSAVLRVLSRHAPSGSSLLDVGCSFGGFLEQARIHGFSVQGMDIVPEAVECVRQQGIPCQEAASIGELDLSDDSIDIVSVLDCNYYWADQRNEVRAAWRKLRPSGLLVMRLVDKSWMLSAGLAVRKFHAALGDRLCARAVNDHRVSIPLSFMLRLLQQEGFEIVEASIREATYSEQSSTAVKVSHAIGPVIWRLTGWNVAPGALVLARKLSHAQPMPAGVDVMSDSDVRATFSA